MVFVRTPCESCASAGNGKGRWGGARGGGGELSTATDGVVGRPIGLAELLATEEAKGLLEAAHTTGALTTEDIAAALDDLDLDAAVVDDFYQALEELHIEIVGRAEADDDDADEGPSREISTDALQL